LTTVVLITIIALAIGMTSNVIDEVSKGYPAEKAGLLPGDRIIQINGENVEGWNDVTGILSSGTEDSVKIVVKRDGKEIALASEIAMNDEGRRVIGITSRLEHSITKSLKAGVLGTWEWTKEMYNYLRQLFTGKGSMNDLVGPVGIVSIINDQAKMGIFYIINLTALISLNLAIVNMLPFPALDGGRLLFLIVGQITGKRISDSIEAKIHFAGLMLLFALMIYLVIQDVDRFILN
ncbi:MAG TPA: RIP metalloprotease RseP, partial [Anaerovoracaceae bacterium]|nr:RIP metalloprotease RseP [Anaerovoracaceae bacterium]